MTFDEFKASGRAVDDLRTLAFIGDAYEFKQPGRVYAGDLVIEESMGAAAGNWCLTIIHDTSISDDLADLERKLYHFGLSEDRFPPTGSTEKALCEELQAFCFANDLPQECADDLLMCQPLTTCQRRWLSQFCVRWSAVVGE
jgi:hypothetical protein